MEERAAGENHAAAKAQSRVAKRGMAKAAAEAGTPSAKAIADMSDDRDDVVST